MLRLTKRVSIFCLKWLGHQWFNWLMKLPLFQQRMVLLPKLFVSLHILFRFFSVRTLTLLIKLRLLFTSFAFHFNDELGLDKRQFSLRLTGTNLPPEFYISPRCKLGSIIVTQFFPSVNGLCGKNCYSPRSSAIFIYFNGSTVLNMKGIYIVDESSQAI